MSAEFDPYYRWLAIPPEEQPPNHYRLLGLKLFEADPEVIEGAADRQLAHLRGKQGDLAELSQQLQSEIALAKVCLLDPRKKAAYDAELKAAEGAGETNALPAAEPDKRVSTGQVKHSKDAARSIGTGVAAVLVIGLVAVGGVIVLLLAGIGGMWWLVSGDDTSTVAEADPGAAPVQVGLSNNDTPPNSSTVSPPLIPALPPALPPPIDPPSTNPETAISTESSNETDDVPSAVSDPLPEEQALPVLPGDDEPSNDPSPVGAVASEKPAPGPSVIHRANMEGIVDPELFGFDIPLGRLRRGNDRVVLVRDDDGLPVVAKIHVEVGQNLIVMLPDGRLVARRRYETQGTTRPFEPATKDALAARLVAGEYQGFRIKQTRRYLYIYNTSEPFVTATSRILETMFPGVMAFSEAQRIDVHEPEVPLVVVLYKDRAEFERRTGVRGGVVAFYNTLDNRVAIYETQALARIAPLLAVREAISTIAHEGVHQVLANIGVEQRLSRWPMWLSEGMAEFFSPVTVDTRLRWGGAGGVNTLRMLELDAYLRSRTKVDGSTVTRTVLAPRLTSTGYATAWSITHFLAKNHRADFHSFVNEVSQVGPLERPSPEQNLALFTKYFGDDYRTLEVNIHRHLKSLAGE